jgi:glycerol-3-phosphate cytidylyltransferase-like family protein
MKTVVIMPGGFHPFHAGHFSLYNDAKKAFPGADVYVAATNDTSTRPFPFAVKEKLAQLAGVEPGRFVQVKSPFRAEEITQKYNPEDTVLIFVRSEKDRNSQPRPGGTKKDGSPSYLQPLGRDLKPMTQHAYMEYLPTVEFGPGITSASEIRAAWPKLNDKRKTAMVMSLYPATQKNPQLAAVVVRMLDTAIGTELTEQPNQAGVGANAQAAVANTQPQTATTTTIAPKPSVGTTQAAVPRPSVGSTQPTTAQTTTIPAATGTSMQPNDNITNLARRLGVDPKKLQGELQTMQEDYLDEKRG